MAKHSSEIGGICIPPIKDVEESVRIIRGNTADMANFQTLAGSGIDFRKHPLSAGASMAQRAMYLVALGVIKGITAASEAKPRAVISQEQAHMPPYMRKDPVRFAHDFVDRSEC